MASASISHYFQRHLVMHPRLRWRSTTKTASVTVSHTGLENLLRRFNDVCPKNADKIPSPSLNTAEGAKSAFCCPDSISVSFDMFDGAVQYFLENSIVKFPH